MNSTDEALNYKLMVADQQVELTIPAHAIQTITY
jgi:hypothetical protein